MTPRERLQRITKEANDAGRVAACSDNDAAALRELDQLLADCAHYLYGYGLEDQESKLYERLAQAGYGEK